MVSRIIYSQLKKTLSGKKHKSLTMRPNGALVSVKTCLFSKTRAHYNNTGCLSLFFKLSWKENILNVKRGNSVLNSIVYTFHPTTFFQRDVYIFFLSCFPDNKIRMRRYIMFSLFRFLLWVTLHKYSTVEVLLSDHLGNLEKWVATRAGRLREWALVSDHVIKQ